MSHIYSAVLLKNEENRYLPEFLDYFSPLVDGMFWLDNGSTDNTFKIISGHPKTIAAIQDETPFSQETFLRKKLFSLYSSKIPDDSWVLAFDTDEFPEDIFKTSLQQLISQPINWVGFRFLNMWRSRTHYRIDGLWAPNMFGARMFRYSSKKQYLWPEARFACGSIPHSIIREKGLNSNIFIKHLGYARPEDIPKKYALYSQKETIPFHQRQHIESIIKPPVLKEYIPTISSSTSLLAPSPVFSEPAPTQTPLQENELPLVTIGCPVRNRGWILEDYLSAMENLDYPKEKISFLFVVNDSTDNSKEILDKFKEQKEENYCSINIIEKNFNAPEDTRDGSLRIHRLFYTLVEVRNIWLTNIRPENWGFSVDSDILVPPNSLKKLVSNKKDVCSAFISNEIVPREVGKTHGNILNFLSPMRTRCHHIKAKPLGAVIPVDVTGAVYLISPKAIANVRFVYDRQGEDIGWCRSAINQKMRPYCDTSIIPVHAMEKERYLEWKKRGPIDGREYNFVNFPSEVKVPS